MEGRIENNGNQEKGKEEKEALRKSVRSNKGTPKASPKFFGWILRALSREWTKIDAWVWGFFASLRMTMDGGTSSDYCFSFDAGFIPATAFCGMRFSFSGQR